MLHFYFMFILCVLLFVSEFFPIPTTDPSENNLLQKVGNMTVNISEIYKPDVNMTILIVIDALRLDFVTPNYMPFTTSITNRHGCFNKVTVQTPTVTMPRIKALTTGNVPQYLDIIRNLATSENLVDSWLHSAKALKKNMVFYGDDTWLNLFPKIFVRSEGTTSFFVNDFKEVDYNVTRNVQLELVEKDFDIMILHYLGLDHIGHVLGPYSDIIPGKLKEMDEAIEKIYKMTKNDKPLILVTGDHGMRDSGGHGGSTYSETNVPLLAIGLSCENTTMQQTDIPVNLAVLLGLKIPSMSIGQLNSRLLKNTPFKKYLYGLRYNTHLLLQKNNVCEEGFHQATHFHMEFLKQSNLTAAFLASSLYSDCSQKITESLFKRLVKRDLHSMISYIFIMLSIVCILVRNLLFRNPNEKYLIISLFTLFLLTRFFWTPSMFSFIFFCIMFKNLLNILLISKLNIKARNNSVLFLIIACFVQPFTLFSSSYVEEEHQFWYFLLNVFLILCILANINNECRQKYVLITELLLALCLFRFIRRINSIGDKWGNYPDISDWLLKSENVDIYNLYFVLGLCLVWYLVSDKNQCNNLISFLILLSIFLLKTGNIKSIPLGKIVWLLILITKLVFKMSWKNSWILVVTLLLKPYNIVLIPFSVFSSKVFKTLHSDSDDLSLVHLLLSNTLYFAQGHCNSLASVDVSSGYVGLTEYNPFLVITQVLFHTFSFPILFDLLVFTENVNKNRYFLILFVQKSFVTVVTCLVALINSEHLFIWSVFAPKLIIECVHILFLFLKICNHYLVNNVHYNKFITNYES